MKAENGREVQVSNPLGLHMRAAARFADLARTFTSRIEVSCAGNTADGKSILDLLCLAARDGSLLQLQATGPDGVQALAALADFVDAGFPEPCAQPPRETHPASA